MKQLQILVSLLLGLLLVTSAHAAQRTLKIVSTNAQAQKRIALVIGNAAYQGAPALRNPVNDAKAMSDFLNGLGFEVIEVTDATQKEMNRAITAFGSKLNTETAALFFYAGHGMQVRGKNYIIPVDAQIEAEAAVATEAVSVDAVLEQLNASPVSIVILDACRNNPFERSFRKMGGGLAQMDAPKGSFIAYATAPGKTAADGDGKHGLFTQELLKQINVSGLTLESVFKRVRSNVATKSGDAQMPWDSSSMTGEFFFKPAQVTSLEPVPIPMPAQVHIKSKEEIEQETWENARDSNDTESIAEYLKQYPHGKYVALANIQYKKLKKDATKAARQAHKTDKMFWDCPDCPEMVVIPVGSFDMGSNNGGVSEKPVHRVTISQTFAIGKTEVTQGQWRAVMGNNPSVFADCGDTCPVDSVSWNDAQEFIQKLNAKTGKQYRLPTEAEWEYACYGGSHTEYCGGNDINLVAWYRENSGSQTHPVGKKQANSYGLYDMSGNVWEWMQDWFDNKTQQSRVLRGGSFYNYTAGDYAANRYFDAPTFRMSNIGFRLARTLP
jgi:formylglycine-generating enzyme required for sulfatase activity